MRSVSIFAAAALALGTAPAAQAQEAEVSSTPDSTGARGAFEGDYLVVGAAGTYSPSYDGSDDLLDPKRGFRLSARLSPEASLQSGTFGYLKAQLDASAAPPPGDAPIQAVAESSSDDVILLSERLQATEQLLAAIQASKSWRITAPLRAVNALVRRRR